MERTMQKCTRVSGAYGTEHRAQGTGLRAQGPGLRAQGTGLRAQGSGLRAQGTGLRAQGTGLRAQGSGLRAQGTGLRAQSAELRAQGSELRAQSARLRAQSAGLRAQASHWFGCQSIMLSGSDCSNNSSTGSEVKVLLQNFDFRFEDMTRKEGEMETRENSRVTPSSLNIVTLSNSVGCLDKEC
jgi:hypothetical protein